MLSERIRVCVFLFCGEETMLIMLDYVVENELRVRYASRNSWHLCRYLRTMASSSPGLADWDVGEVRDGGLSDAEAGR